MTGAKPTPVQKASRLSLQKENSEPGKAAPSVNVNDDLAKIFRDGTQAIATHRHALARISQCVCNSSDRPNLLYPYNGFTNEVDARECCLSSEQHNEKASFADQLFSCCRTTDLFQQLESRSLTADEQAIIDQRVGIPVVALYSLYPGSFMMLAFLLQIPTGVVIIYRTFTSCES